MNILVFSWRDPKHPMAGGAEQVVHEHMKGWIKAGHNVVLFSSMFKDARESENLDGVEIIRDGSQILTVQLKGLWWYFFGNHKKFDLVIDQFHGLPFFTPLYVKEKKLAIIQEVAKEVWLMNHLPKPLNWLVGGLGYLSEPLFFLPYKKVLFITGSESAKKDVINMGIDEKNIKVVNHGVIIPKLRLNNVKNKKPIVMFLGALAKDKGIEDAIKTFSILNSKGNYDFWIVGKGASEYLDDLKKMVKDLKIKNVKFWGFVSQQEKFSLLRQATVLINPSFREGWGLVNIESNAMGTPVIAYKSAGLVDSIKNNKTGVLCKKNTPDCLAENVIELINDKSRMGKMEKDCINWAKKFNWKDSSKKSLKILESLND